MVGSVANAANAGRIVAGSPYGLPGVDRYSANGLWLQEEFAPDSEALTDMTNQAFAVVVSPFAPTPSVLDAPTAALPWLGLAIALQVPLIRSVCIMRKALKAEMAKLVKQGVPEKHLRAIQQGGTKAFEELKAQNQI
jgi:hypothetical protein